MPTRPPHRQRQRRSPSPQTPVPTRPNISPNKATGVVSGGRGGGWNADGSAARRLERAQQGQQRQPGGGVDVVGLSKLLEDAMEAAAEQV